MVWIDNKQSVAPKSDPTSLESLILWLNILWSLRFPLLTAADIGPRHHVRPSGILIGLRIIIPAHAHESGLSTDPTKASPLDPVLLSLFVFEASVGEDLDNHGIGVDSGHQIKEDKRDPLQGSGDLGPTRKQHH